MNLGGGFGIKYTEENDPVPYESYMEKVSEVVKDSCKKLGIKLPFIIIEQGVRCQVRQVLRSIHAEE